MVVDAVAQHSLSGEAETEPIVACEMLHPPELEYFELLEEIGRGWMGVVYRARQQSLQRDVAVKIILRGAQASADEQARFQAEVAAAVQLDHPHIVPVYEVGTHEGWQYFGMKLIEAQTLAQSVNRGPLPENDASRLVMQLARAIEYDHGRA